MTLSNDGAELAGAIQELFGLQSSINQMAQMAPASVEDKVREWVQKVRNIADKFGPTSYAISVGIPLGLSASFTWTTDAPN